MADLIKVRQAQRLQGWGRHPAVNARELQSEDLLQMAHQASLFRGLGRSYGDASLPATETAIVASTRLGDRILAFDADTGRLRVEAGCSLQALNRLFWPRGWSCPVLPGTQIVTMGGMVASDVHGKNHHLVGCMGEHVTSLRMCVASGDILDVDDDREQELLRATIGGMGLTGHILEVELQLVRIPSPWIWQETEQHPDLESLLGALERAGEDWPFTVTWVDCLQTGSALGRGILIKGRWAEPHEAPRESPKAKRTIAVPFDMPGWLLNPLSMRAFNFLYFNKHGKKVRRGIAHPQSYFHPLDALHDWNRLYGKKGFIQYQCVIPRTADPSLRRRFFETFVHNRGASFLSVIKDCGDEGKGMLSYPLPGVSIALDIPMRGAHTQAIVDALNEIVIEAGGRIYLTKDSLTRPEHFRAMEPRLDAWSAVRRKWDPDQKIKSAQSLRLLGDAT